MSSSLSFGKDKVIFATKEDHAEPSTIQLPEPERQPGLLLPNGEINWNCPCLGGMATGPCGVEFRESFSCFHYSSEESKGVECYETFAKMQECFLRYPGVYKTASDDENFDGLNDDEDGEKKREHDIVDGAQINANSNANSIETSESTDQRTNTSIIEVKK